MSSFDFDDGYRYLDDEQPFGDHLSENSAASQEEQDLWRTVDEESTAHSNDLAQLTATYSPGFNKYIPYFVF